MAERWRRIGGFEDYMVSDNGDVASLKTGKRKLLSPGKSGNGYLHVQLSMEGQIRSRTVHRLVLEAFRGDCPRGFIASHLNGNATDNRLINLVWESQTDNLRRKREHGTQNHGETHGQAILCDSSVLAMRRRYRAGESARAIACDYRVTDSAARNAIHGITWGHVPDPVTSPLSKASPGEKNGRAKLTESDVREIRERHRRGEFVKDIAASLGMGQSPIRRIVNREAWRHVR